MNPLCRQHHPLSILNLQQFTLSSWHTLPRVRLVYTPRHGPYWISQSIACQLTTHKSSFSVPNFSGEVANSANDRLHQNHQSISFCQALSAGAMTRPRPRFPQRGWTFLGPATSSAYLGKLAPKEFMRDTKSQATRSDMNYAKNAKNKSFLFYQMSPQCFSWDAFAWFCAWMVSFTAVSHRSRSCQSLREAPKS